MNIVTVIFEYRVTRSVEIVTDENLSDEEIEARARKADTEITEHSQAGVIGLRRTLAASPYNIAIRRESDDFNTETGKAVINKLITLNCFAPDGRLGVWPKWLKQVMIDRLVALGLFRRQAGNLENYMDVQYYRVNDWESK